MGKMRTLPYYLQKKDIIQDSGSTKIVEEVNNNFEERNEILEEFMGRIEEEEKDKETEEEREYGTKNTD